MYKHITALLLALVMLFSALPMAALAEENAEVTPPRRKIS